LPLIFIAKGGGMKQIVWIILSPLVLAHVNSSMGAGNSVLSGNDTERWESEGKTNDAEIFNSSDKSIGPDGFYVERVKVTYSLDHFGKGFMYRSVIYTNSVDCENKRVYPLSAIYYDLNENPVSISKSTKRGLQDGKEIWDESSYEPFCSIRKLAKDRPQVTTIPIN
jgi:hypothetical protein